MKNLGQIKMDLNRIRGLRGEERKKIVDQALIDLGAVERKAASDPSYLSYYEVGELRDLIHRAQSDSSQRRKTNARKSSNTGRDH
jgi:hypothetical protein